jgi:hypothetical protein
MTVEYSSETAANFYQTALQKITLFIVTAMITSDLKVATACVDVYRNFLTK